MGVGRPLFIFSFKGIEPCGSIHLMEPPQQRDPSAKKRQESSDYSQKKLLSSFLYFQGGFFGTRLDENNGILKKTSFHYNEIYIKNCDFQSSTTVCIQYDSKIDPQSVSTMHVVWKAWFHAVFIVSVEVAAFFRSRGAH
jgi:hypothetical protein